MNQRLISALRAGFLHLLLSLGVAFFVAGLVFLVWYPWPFSELVGGRGLFFILVGVDVVCGPLLTLILWNPKNPRREVCIDIGLVVTIQAVALVYGLHTVVQARPVHLVFEVDRLRLITAAEIAPEDLPLAPPHLRTLPWTGPTLIGVRPPRDSEEKLRSINLSIAGLEPSLRPGWWQDYALNKDEVLGRARSIDVLYEARPQQRLQIEAAIRDAQRPESDLCWLPLTSARNMEWVVFLDRVTALPLAYAHVDGFF